jgi:hypothetical protein
MQRVRIGLTGLACVFLLVLLGAIFVKFVRDGEAARQSETMIASGSAPSSVAGDTTEAPKEPLAELGITPGNAPEAGANTAKQPTQ